MKLSSAFVIALSFSFLLFTSLFMYHGNSSLSSGLRELDAGKEQLDTSSTSTKQGKKATSKPNIFLIVMDDLGWNDIGYQNSDLAAFTPTMDKLAAEGIKLNRHYAMSMCTPTRAALLTGRHPVQLGMQHSLILPAAPWGLPLTETILPQYLKKGGYEAHMVGKWHLGHYKSEYLPLERGFDSFYGYHGPGMDYQTHVSLDGCTTSLNDDDDSSTKVCTTDMFDGDTFIGEDDNVKGTFSTVLFENRIADLLSSYDSDSPLFMYLPFQNVHAPLTMYDEYYDNNRELFDTVPNDDRRTFSVLLKLLDDAISELMRVTKENGLFENSYFIFVSDNGGDPSSGGNNYPLRGLKNTLFEGGVRTPSFVYSPLLPSDVRGTEYNKMFHVTDWLPTILEGILNRNVEHFVKETWYGVNQWGAMMGEDETPRDEILLNMDYLNEYDEISTVSGALIKGQYKYIKDEKRTSWYDVPGAGETVEIKYKSKANLLFDIVKDPIEFNDYYNTSEEHNAISDMMEERLHELQRTLMKRCIWKEEDKDYAWNVWKQEEGYPLVPYMDNGYSEVELETNMYQANPDRWDLERSMFIHPRDE